MFLEAQLLQNQYNFSALLKALCLYNNASTKRASAILPRMVFRKDGTTKAF